MELTKLFKVLSDETRLRILVLLTNGTLCVGVICEVLDLSQPNVSKHLAKLRDFGLVKDERHEQYIYYSLNNGNVMLSSILKRIIDQMDQYEVFKNDRNHLLKMDGQKDYCEGDVLR